MIVQNPNNKWKCTDLIKALPVEAQKQNLMEALGIFGEDLRATRNLTIRRDVVNGTAVPRINYDGRRVNITPDSYISMNVEIPRVGIEDSIKAADLQDYMDISQDVAQARLQALAPIRAKKMTKLNDTLRHTLEVDRLRTLLTGSAYDPTGVLRRSYGTFNIYEELGITRQSQALSLGAADNPTDSINELYTKVRDATYQYGGGRVVVLAGKTLFNKVAGNPFVVDAKLQVGGNYVLSQLVGRPTAVGLDYRFRSVEFQDVLFIDASSVSYLDELGAYTSAIGDEVGVAMAVADGLYTTYFAPEQRFDTVNRTAAARMLRERMNDEQDLYQMFAESNFFNMLEVPEGVITVTIAA